MFAINVRPQHETDLIAKCGQCKEIATVVFTGQRGQAALVFEVADEFVYPVRFSAVQRAGSRDSVAFQRSGDQVPDASEKVDTHPRMEAVCVGAADCQETELCLVAQR